MAYASIPAAFRRTAAQYATLPVIRLLDRQVSFGELDRSTDRLAAGLAAHGIGPGHRVALYCSNSPEFVQIYLGILKAGATVVPVNLLLSPPEIHYILQNAGVDALCYQGVLAERVAIARHDLVNMRLGVAIGPAIPLPGDIPLDALLAAAGAPPALSYDPSNDVAAILYTSGTTGHPKGAQLTHCNLLANTTAVYQFLELRPGEDVLLVVLPMFHAFAATVGMLTPLLHGLSLVPVPRFEPGLVVDYIEATEATIFLGVPSMYTLFMRLAAEQIPRWRSVRFCVSGGAALPVAILEGFERRFGIPVLEGDGPTECGPVTCVNPLEGPRKPGSVGRPLAGVEMRVCDDQGVELPDNALGEVCVRGASVMKGYWNHPEADAESFRDGWFSTGDLGYRDADGYFFLVDRKKDMLIVNGMNVYPRILEEVLHRHPDIAEATVVGEPHPLHGEVPIAHVVAKEGATLDPAEVRAWCRNQLGRYELPRRVVVRQCLPRNAAGKVLKRELRREGELERGVDHLEPHDARKPAA
jgi:long-chain acyl-CoA synthetase